MGRISIADARQIDLVGYLDNLGYKPVKIRRNDYWYLSPLRTEKTASFKVDQRINKWYDFGLGKGGSLVDFGIALFQCTVSDFLQQLSGELNLPIRILSSSNESVPDQEEHKIKILGEKELNSFALLAYLKARCIPAGTALQYCKEVHYKLGNHNYYAIGFKNRSGGYELRNAYIKLSSSPKDITYLKNGFRILAIFEGFIDFLSFLVLRQSLDLPECDYLILNMAAFFARSLDLMVTYDEKLLFLDNDPTGHNYRNIAMALNAGFTDKSDLYNGYTDLNEWHCARQIGNAD